MKADALSVISKLINPSHYELVVINDLTHPYEDLAQSGDSDS